MAARPKKTKTKKASARKQAKAPSRPKKKNKKQTPLLGTRKTGASRKNAKKITKGIGNRGIEPKAKQGAGARAKKDAEAKAKRAAKAKAKRTAEAKARRAAEAKAKLAAEVRAKQAARARAKRPAKTNAKRAARSQTKVIEAKAKQVARGKAKGTPSGGLTDIAAKRSRLAEARQPEAGTGKTEPDQPEASSKPRYYITTAIAYPNGPPHIGYGYEVITTDAIARFKRLDGYDVFFLTGTDEHGIKIAQTAGRDGITPKQLVDKNSARFQEMAKLLNASNDQFIRTTEPHHHKSSQAIWERMKANGDIYLSKYAGWYSVRDEAYYDESETRIENGVRIGALGTPVEWVEEESYFFKLSAYQDKLLKLYADVPDFVLPRERLNEVASFVRGGLRDLSVSRTTFDWGVKVPGDEKHVMYVWVDALTNYITAAGFPDDQSASFKKWWPADLHVIGKDIVRFHAVYWPAFLMSAGIAVPRYIFSHGWILNRGEKMSKSVGNVADPFALVEAYGVDPLRYFFMREVSFGQDGNYSHEAIVARINADLSNDLGNLAQRSLTMVGKAFGGAMPKPGAFSENDKTILAAADAMIGKAREAMNGYALHQVLNAVWAVVADANRYFAGEAPWALAKTDPARQGTVLYVTAEVIRQVAILSQPFMPASAAKLLDLLGIPEGDRDFSALEVDSKRVAPETKLGEIKPVFPRYVEPEAEAG